MISLDRYQTRPMTEADIAQIVEIERESFPTAWPRTAYKRELANQFASYLVLVDRSAPPRERQPSIRRRSLLRLLRPEPEAPATADNIVGYIGVWFMVDEAHIVAIAVRESYRGLGLGELLIGEAIQMSLASNVSILTLEVRRSNLIAQALYEKYRFLKVGTRKRYYSDNHEDAIIMSTPPIQADSFREHMAYLKGALEKRWAEAD